MSIEATTRIDATRRAAIGASRPAAAARFHVPEDADPAHAVDDGPAAAGPPGKAGSVSLGAMLAAEALDRGAVRDRAARRYGQVVLAGLGAVQLALLAEGDPADVLQRLAATVGDVERAADPALAALVDSIVLRARIELARRPG